MVYQLLKVIGKHTITAVLYVNLKEQVQLC